MAMGTLSFRREAPSIHAIFTPEYYSLSLGLNIPSVYRDLDGSLHPYPIFIDGQNRV